MLFVLFQRKNHSYTLNKNLAKTVNILSYYHPLTLKTLSLRFRKSIDKNLKNHYINSKKASITNGKNTYKRQVCNQQEIN